MSKSKDIFKKIKKIVTANTYRNSNDVYKNEGIGLNILLLNNSVKFSINTDSRKISVDDIIDENLYFSVRHFRVFLKENYNIDYDNLDEDSKKMFTQMNEELHTIFSKNFYDTQDTPESKMNKKSIEYSKILSTIVKSFLIEEVENYKKSFNDYAKLVDEKAKQLVEFISNNTKE